MKKFLCALAVLPFMSASALAQPAQLSDYQMDSVSAGFRLNEVEVSNTSWTQVVVGEPLRACTSCYLTVVGSSFGVSVSSNFGPVPTLGL